MASKTIPLLYLLVILIAKKGVDATIGINWGRENAQRLIPSMVVDLLLQNGVKEARIYTTSEYMLQAFANSGIGLTLDVGDYRILQNYDLCEKWVRSRMVYFNQSNVRRVYVGNSSPFLAGLKKNKDALHKNIALLRNLQTALNNAGWGHQVKVTMTHNMYTLTANLTKPSDAEIPDEVKHEMLETLRFLEQNDSPFVIDMIPSLAVEYYGMNQSFAFVGDSDQIIKDRNGAVYTNIFEFLHDSFVSALAKLGYPDMKIIVGQVGWPTDGYRLGSASITERFFKGLLPYVASNKGTPLRPGAPIDTYVHSLTDENRLPDDFMRHWGIYRSNGKPKFKIDLTGQGRDIYPTRARGNMRMPERWCVYNGNRTDYPSVMWQQSLACKKSDCSSLRQGSSCGKLSFNQNISYAFNMYFQFKFQDEKACRFGGLSYITVENPSTDKCLFPIEVVEGEQENYVKVKIQPSASSSKGYHHSPNRVISLFLLSLLGILLWNGCTYYM